MQEERGDNGTVHLQGVCYFSQPVTLAAVKKLHTRAHWEVMKGTLDQAIAYCMKEDTQIRPPVTWGDKPQQGKRSDLHDCAIAMAEVDGSVQKKLRHVAEINPSAFIKYHRGFAALAALQVKPVPKGKPESWHDWQRWLLDYLRTEPNDRTIVWVTDPTGGRGKSTLVQHLITTYPEEYTYLSGKVPDMAFAYNGTRVVFFDVPRTQLDFMNHLYNFAEQLKNGAIFSTKFESGLKTFKSPHVVFFANAPPDYSKWSHDRVLHIDLEPFTPDTLPVLPFIPPVPLVDNPNLDQDEDVYDAETEPEDM